MREIKFRCFNKTEKYYVNDFLINQDGTVVSHDDLQDYPVVHFNEFILEQFTGLNDKNGKEIYQGDILKTKYKKNNYIVDDLLEFGWYYHEFICHEKLIEIIGNIHENPELLENK